MKWSLCVLFCYIVAQHGTVGQVLQFGTCPDVTTVEYFALERFMGTWYVIERFPSWYESEGHCAYKRFQVCGRRIAIEHGFVKDEIEYVLHINSTYNPGDDAVFTIERNNIDPIGIPISVIATDYNNYAILYGCNINTFLNIKYTVAWILSRDSSLAPEILIAARNTLNVVPYTSPSFLEPVHHDEVLCSKQWTAHVQAAYR